MKDLSQLHAEGERLFDEKYPGFDLSGVKLDRLQEKNCVVASPEKIKSFIHSRETAAYKAALEWAREQIDLGSAQGLDSYRRVSEGIEKV